MAGGATYCVELHKPDAVRLADVVAGGIQGADRGALVREGLRAGYSEHEDRLARPDDGCCLGVREHHNRYKDRALVGRQTCIREATTNYEHSRRSLGAAEIVGSLLRRAMFPEVWWDALLLVCFEVQCRPRFKNTLDIMLSDITPAKTGYWGKPMTVKQFDLSIRMS